MFVTVTLLGTELGKQLLNETGISCKKIYKFQTLEKEKQSEEKVSFFFYQIVS